MLILSNLQDLSTSSSLPFKSKLLIYELYVEDEVNQLKWESWVGLIGLVECGHRLECSLQEIGGETSRWYSTYRGVGDEIF